MKRRKHLRHDPAQFHLLPGWKPTPKLASPYRLRTGDVVLYEGKPCAVLSVGDCAAVISVNRRDKEFTTIFGKCVRFRPKPALVRISSNSLCPILNRQHR